MTVRVQEIKSENTQSSGLSILKGTIANIKAEKKNQNGTKWQAGRIKANGQFVNFSGVLNVQPGDSVILYGKWKEWKGIQQFKADHAEIDLGIDSMGLANYLSGNPKFDGVGPVKAGKMIEDFGENLAEECYNHPGEIAGRYGISDEVAYLIGEDLLSQNQNTKAKIFLSQFGISMKRILQLIEKFGDSIINYVKEDPYMLIGTIPRFGFADVDKLALSTGIDKRHAGRLQAAILHSMQKALDNGKCWLKPDDLVNEAFAILHLDPDTGKDEPRNQIRIQINNLILKEELKYVNNEIVVLPWVWRTEVDLYKWFKARRSIDQNMLIKDRSIPPGLNEDQQKAVQMAFERSTCSITGAAGTGKTHIIKQIIDRYESEGKKVGLCAPTGKAAMRAQESTDRDAFTIHRLLDWQFDGFTYNKNNPLDYDLIVVDEMSMVDLKLCWDLLQSITYNTNVIFVGDINQLPPVGCGQPFHDILLCDLTPSTRLSQVVRQAGVLEKNSAAVLEGFCCHTYEASEGEISPWICVNNLPSSTEVISWIESRLEKMADYYKCDIRDIQILTPQRKGPAGTNVINKIVQDKVQRATADRDTETKGYIRKGDKVIQTRNNYDLNVMNGQTGVIIDQDMKLGWRIQWDDGKADYYPWEFCEDLELAYAITIHKSQGSEFPYVIFVCHSEHAFMLDRALAYTALTRAKRGVCILCNVSGYKTAVSKINTNRRNTTISYMRGTDLDD